MTLPAGDRLVLERIPYDPVAWGAIVKGHPDLEVYHGPAWLAYLAETQGAEPVIAVVRLDGRIVGHFVGGMVRRYGVRILGSPMKGWGTQCMGFLLDAGIDRLAAAEALLGFAFGDLGCSHVELADRRLVVEETAALSYARELGMTFVVDLRPSEQEILGRMESNTRRLIRKARRSGLRVETATDLEFAEEFYGHLRAVFARQGLVPTYDIERVRRLILNLQPTGQLFMVRIASPAGRPIAAGISVGGGRTAVVWGVGFDRAWTPSHPNQSMWWEMMRTWRERGASYFDMGGGGEYKDKYGGDRIPTVHLYRSRYAVMRHGRSAIRRLVKVRQVVRGRRARPRERDAS